MKTAAVYYSGTKAGTLTETGSGYVFEYASEYLAFPQARPVSLSLPLRADFDRFAEGLGIDRKAAANAVEDVLGLAARAAQYLEASSLGPKHRQLLSAVIAERSGRLL
ncbi:MAG: HipA N-terminal domain-containing protein [Elusimicrobiales bacterium]